MPIELDELKAALKCIIDGRGECRKDLCPYSDKLADDCGLYACNITEIAKAAAARIRALEDAVFHPDVTVNGMLVLRCKTLNLRREHIEKMLNDMNERIKNGDMVVAVPAYFDVVYVPKDTTVRVMGWKAEE